MEVANLVSRPIECSATTSQASLEAALFIPSSSRCLSLTSASHGFPSGLYNPLFKRRTGSGFCFPRVVLVSSQYRHQGSAVAGDKSDAYGDGGNVERSARGTSENKPFQYPNDGNGMWNRAGQLENGRYGHFQGEEDAWQRNSRYEGSAAAGVESDAFCNGDNVKRSARGTSENRHSQHWNDGNGIWTRARQPRNGRFQGEDDAWQRSTRFERTNADVSEDIPKGGFTELSESQPSRLHNRFTVFERVTEPEVVPLSPKRVSKSSASAQPDAFSQSSLSIRNTSSLSQAPSQRSALAPSLGISGGALLSSSTVDSGSNPLGKDDKTGSKFTSKLQEILDNFKKKGRLQKKSVAEEGPRNKLVPQRDEPLPLLSRINGGSGFQRTRTDGMPKGGLVPEHQSFTADMNKDENRYHQVVESDIEDNDVEAPFNFFSKPPAIPWESNHRPSSDSNPHTINKRRDISTPARSLSKSIGSRSTPSRSSIPGKYSKYSKPEPKKGRIKTIASSSIKLEKPSQSLPTEVEGTKLQGVSELGEGNDGYFDEDVSHTTFSSSGLQHSELQNAKNSRHSNLFDWSDSDSEDETDTPTAMSVSNPIAGAELPCEQEDSQLSSTEKVTTSVSTEPTDAGPLANLRVPDLPFAIQFSYSENPNAPVLGYREPQFSPFGPRTMPRPWTGGPPLKPQKKKVPEFDSFNPPPKGKKGIKPVQDPGPYPAGEGPRPAKTREEILGAPLTKEEIVMLVERCQRESRQLNLGRDGLTHNMLDLIHTHWKRRRVCKIKCKGVPTVDMDNVCFHIEEKTGGKIIYRTGGVLYLFRGRNYNYKDRPRIPLMLWKPAAPIYPKLIQQIPEGLTRDQAFKLRLLGRKVEPLCKLAKNGVYLDLVKDVRNAFKVDDLVSIDCEGLNPSDYKKIGAKLRDLVPCVLLSFKDEKILMWKGRGSDTSSVSDSNHGETAAVLTSNPANNISSNVVSNVESCTSNLSGSIASDKISSSSTSQLNPSRPNVEVDVSCNERSLKNTIIGGSDDVDNEGQQPTCQSVGNEMELSSNERSLEHSISGASDDIGDEGQQPTCQSVGNEMELASNERSLEHSISGASDDIGDEGQQPTCQSVGNEVELASNARSLKHSISGASNDIRIQEQQPPCQSVSDEIVLDSSMYTKDNSTIPDGGAVQSTGLFNEVTLERSLGKDELITNGLGYGEINASCALTNSCVEGDMDRIVSTDMLPAGHVLKEEKWEDVLEAKYDWSIQDGTSMGEFDGALEEPLLLTYPHMEGEAAEESRRESLIVAGMEGLNNGLECQKDVQVGPFSQLQLKNGSNSMNLSDDSVMYDSEEEARQITSSKYQLSDEDRDIMSGNQDEVQQDVFSVSEFTQESEASTVRVDALWEQAVQSGMAIELVGSDLDADYVLEMANELAQSAPPGPVYTHGLIHRLSPKRMKEDSDDELNIHFGRLKEKQRKQKHSRRPRAPLPTVDVPAMGGLPVDQLAKLLSPK